MRQFGRELRADSPPADLAGRLVEHRYQDDFRLAGERSEAPHADAVWMVTCAECDQIWAMTPADIRSRTAWLSYSDGSPASGKAPRSLISTRSAEAKQVTLAVVATMRLADQWRMFPPHIIDPISVDGQHDEIVADRFDR